MGMWNSGVLYTRVAMCPNNYRLVYTLGKIFTSKEHYSVYSGTSE